MLFQMKYSINPSKSKKPEKISTIVDEKDNMIRCHNNGKRIMLFLRLKSENRNRKIGIIRISTKVMDVVRKRDRHLHYKTNSYGFNQTILEQAKRFTHIRLRDEHCVWKIPVAYILENGIWLHHLQSGFERQRFVSLDDLKQFEVEPKI